MAGKSSIDYNPVPTVAPTTQGIGGFSVRATPDAMGAQVGEALQGFGNTTSHLSDKVSALTEQYAQQATEAKANDTIANQWAPQAAELRAGFDQLRGPDKIKGYDGYIGGLQKARDNLLGSATGSYEKQILSGYIGRHISQEIEGAKREQVSALKEFQDQAHYDMIRTGVDNATANYNNPAVVSSTTQGMDAQITKNMIDNGHNPNTEEGKIAITQAQDAAKGTMAVSMINRAVASGDIQTAHNIRASYASNIPGYQQLHIDDILHTASIQQTGAMSVAALKNGQSFPQPVGAPPIQIQALVANTATSGGVDQNHALTVARIESNMGQNLGKRGDIGQTGKGGDLPTQATNMVDELKRSATVADNALGRQSLPWEQYVCYQQGAGGGPALLKAAQENPDTKAVDALLPLYKTKQQALSAISNNGGNASMTAGDFLDFIKQKYDKNSRIAMCTIPTSNDANVSNPEGGVVNETITQAQPSLGDAITAAHSGNGPTIQPAATPTQALLNFDSKSPEMLARINAIPNDEVREGVLKAYNRDRSVYQAASTAYTANLLNKAGQLAVDKNFTSMDQVPPEMAAILAQDHPQTLTYLQTRAEYNLTHSSGGSNKDMREYGKGFYDLFKAVHAETDDPNKINNITQLQSHVGADGDITIAGYDKLVGELKGKNTPEGDAEGLMKRQFFANAKSQISGADEGWHIRDPKGEELYLKFMAQALPAYETGKSSGKTTTQLLNPDSPDYIGNSIKTFKRPPNIWMSDMMQDNQPPLSDKEIQEMTQKDLVAAVKDNKISRVQGEFIAQKRGWIGVQGPQVPVSDGNKRSWH